MTKPLKKQLTVEVDDTFDKKSKGADLHIVKDFEGSSDESFERKFSLKSEFFEKNISLPPHKKLNNRNFTQVKVFKDSGVEEIDPSNLKEIIEETTGIRQVVVEKISLDEATRISLLFEPKDHTDRASKYLGVEHSKHLELYEEEDRQDESHSKSFSIEELENLVNNEFLNKASEDDAIEVKENGPLENNNRLEFRFPKKENNFVENTVSKDIEKSGISLKVKGKNNKVEKNLKYEKHTLSKKGPRKGQAYYYRAKDHVELYKIGNSYLKDFKSGVKSVSFASHGLDEEREKSVFGILSFFNYHENLNICVVTKSLENSFYEKITGGLSKREGQVFDEDLYYDFYTGEGFELIEFKELKRVERKITEYNFEAFLDQLQDSFDLILWDLPSTEILNSNKELYFPIIRSLDNVSFIVGKNKSKISQINEMVSYFTRYQVSIKGLLFSAQSKKGGDS